MKKKSTIKKSSNILSKIIRKMKKIVMTIFPFFRQLSNKISKLGEKNRRIFEISQLTLIYFLGIIQIVITCLQVFGSGSEVYKILPFFDYLVYSPIAILISNPEKTYIFYLLAQELIILRSHIFNFSVIVRYNILYLMTLEFFFFCILNWWDTFCNFEKDLIFKANIDKSFAEEFGLTLFFFYFMIYSYSYIRAVNRKLPVFPNSILQKIPDSVAFWLQIKKQKSDQNS